MGFFSKIFKPVAKLIDPLLPEGVKEVVQKAPLLEPFILEKDTGGGGAPGAGPTEPAIGRLEQSELDEISAKRLARIGRYFTSPLGVLSSANTGSQKVFS